MSEILRLVVKSDNFSHFEQFDDFWIRMSDEILHRTEHLTNDQIVTMVDAFSKPKLFCKKLFDKFEDVIKESKILFTVISYFLTNLACPIWFEKNFAAYTRKKTGSSPTIKQISKHYMLNKVVQDSWQLAKYVSILHNHSASIKGDFGLQKELNLIV